MKLLGLGIGKVESARRFFCEVREKKRRRRLREIRFFLQLRYVSEGIQMIRVTEVPHATQMLNYPIALKLGFCGNYYSLFLVCYGLRHSVVGMTLLWARSIRRLGGTPLCPFRRAWKERNRMTVNEELSIHRMKISFVCNY